MATGDTMAGTPAADLYPSLAAGYPDLSFSTYDPAAVAGLDLVFLGLPHGASQGIVPELLGKVGHLVDLAADFRLQDPSLYPRWYGEAHTAPELLPAFAYGLPELFRDEIKAAAHVATPGCYPTAASLALAPLVRAGVVETTGIIVDAASGVSGAGRPPKPTTTFCTVDEDFTAYGLLDHRHTPEMEQVLGRSVLFTPHLAPMNRGILATCYARPTGATTTDGAARPPAGRLRRRALRRRARGLAVDEGHAGLQRRPRDGSLRRAHRHRAGHRAPSTTSPRVRPAARSSAPTCSSASPRPPASPSPGCSRDGRPRRRAGCQRPARWRRRRWHATARHQALRRPRPEPRRHDRRRARWPRPPSSRRTG